MRPLVLVLFLLLLLLLVLLVLLLLVVVMLPLLVSLVNGNVLAFALRPTNSCKREHSVLQH